MKSFSSRHLFFGIGLTILLLQGGCVSAKSQVAPYKLYPATDAKSVYVYKNYPPVPYEVIGEVRGRGQAYMSWDQVYDSMRKQAANIGGNGVVILSEATPVISTRYVPASVNVNTTSPQITATSQTAPVANTLGNMNASASYTPARTEEITEKVVSGVVIRFKQNTDVSN